MIERLTVNEVAGTCRERWRVGPATVLFTTTGLFSLVAVYADNAAHAASVPVMRIEMHDIATKAGISYQYVSAIGEPRCQIAATDRERFLSAVASHLR